MGNRLLLLSVLLFIGLISFAQNISKSSYWVKFRDKNGTQFQIGHPEAFLSHRAIDRRTRQHIIIDDTDLPVSAVYLDSLKKRGFEVVHTSKWLNGATIRTSDTTLVKKIAALPFITLIEFTRPANTKKSAKLKFAEDQLKTDADPAGYGNAIIQFTQLKGQYLHNNGFRGKGIQIAVLDAGFWHVNSIAAFDSLRAGGRILGTRDFVDPGSDIYQQHTHGMSVLSCMGGNQPFTLIGTAPDASYFLFRSEDDNIEYPIEEDNWVAAAELADSVGVDVINSSLGYSEFDDPKMNHSYTAINGKTTRITQGANMAFQKGILVFNSAGNEGNNLWRHIVAPSDGENVIAVAAVDKLGVRASFSSVGPAFGGAVKPNVAALGSSTYLVTSGLIPGYSSGTSFSSPVLAGMGACLLQANPYSNVKQVKMAIEQSASIFNKPDSMIGYGIPDFEKADKYLKLITTSNIYVKAAWAVSPNPFTDHIFIQNIFPVNSSNCLIRIYSLTGVCLWQSNINSSGTILLAGLQGLPEGFLILSILCGGKEEHFKMIKTGR